MRLARKLFLAMLVATTAAVFTTSSASAQSVEVYQETGPGTMVHCSAVTLTNHIPTGGCSLRAVGTFDIYLHNGSSEILFTGCANTFEARVGEDGEGYMYNQVLAPEGGVCFREPCDEARTGISPHRNLAWPFHIEETGSNLDEEETLIYTFCLYAHNPDPASEGTPGTPCQIELDVIRVGHDYEFVTHPHDGAGNGGSPCINLPQIEIEGHWLSSPSKNHPNSIEIIHHDDL